MEVRRGLAEHDALYLPAMKSPRWLLLLPLMGCSLPAPYAPVRGVHPCRRRGSTYWVRSGPRGINARTSPLILTSADNRFYEVYVDEETRSYEDAIFTREPIYSRDLLSGRKKLLWEEAQGDCVGEILPHRESTGPPARSGRGWQRRRERRGERRSRRFSLSSDRTSSTIAI